MVRRSRDVVNPGNWGRRSASAAGLCLPARTVTRDRPLNFLEDAQPQFAAFNFHASRRQAFEGFRVYGLGPRQVFSDFADRTCDPGRYHIVCIGIEVRFHEIKCVREDSRRLQELFDCWFVCHVYITSYWRRISPDKSAALDVVTACRFVRCVNAAPCGLKSSY